MYGRLRKCLIQSAHKIEKARFMVWLLLNLEHCEADNRTVTRRCAPCLYFHGGQREPARKHYIFRVPRLLSPVFLGVERTSISARQGTNDRCGFSVRNLSYSAQIRPDTARFNSKFARKC